MRNRTTMVAAVMLALGLSVIVPGCSKTESTLKHDWSEVTGKKQQVDLNSATRKELAELPGISDSDAKRIIDNRPYNDPHDLVRKKVIGAHAYDQIASQVYASH